MFWVDFARNTQLVTIIVTFDPEDHQHVGLDSLWDIIVTQMDRLESLRLRQGPLNGFDMLPKVHP